MKETGFGTSPAALERAVRLYWINKNKLRKSNGYKTEPSSTMEQVSGVLSPEIRERASG